MNRFTFICISLLIQSCTFVKITTSDKRNPVTQQLHLGDNIDLTTWGAVKINKAHFFPSSFQVKSKNKIIYIDPLLIESEDKADYIFITHSHPDHLSIPDIKKATKAGTLVVCSQNVATKLRKHNFICKVVKPGDHFDLEKNVSYEAIASYNTKPVLLWIKAHEQSANNVGYVLTFFGKRIYHSGDTDYVPEMQSLKNIDLALVPIGGDNLTMNVREAAKLINEIKPNNVVPMHYELKADTILKVFKSLIGNKTNVITM